ncbi:MAG: sulfatase-like hydrolase/transferase, partial [Duncaniella sp.]|nr:sulfatase-like hydrolase/transferase [Duncaniella sp.]
MKPKNLFSIGSGLVGAITLAGTAHAAENGKPANVIFILADDLGIGDVSPYGQKLIKTPNLDRMTAEGMRFTQAYSGTAVSAPSRASLMTGLHTGHTHIRGNLRHDPEGQVDMPAGTYTMGQMFKNAGYATGCFGKWGLGYPGSESDPTKVGFDNFYGYNCQTLAHDYYPDHLWDNTQRVEFSENYDQKEGTYSADLIHGKALDFMRQQARDGKPFFTFLSYT